MKGNCILKVNTMKKYFLLLAATFSISACVTTLEHIKAPSLGPEWKIGYQHRERFTNNNITEYIPSNESIQNWSKLYTVQYNKNTEVIPASFAVALLNKIKESCPDIQAKLIEKDNKSVLYEWSAPTCKKKDIPAHSPNINTAQHSLFRIIKANEGFFNLSYVEKTAKMNNETRKKWIFKLKNSQVYKDGKIVN